MAEAEDLTCMQLTDRRVYFTWQDMRHLIVTLYEDEENARELSPLLTPPFDEPVHVPPWLVQHGKQHLQTAHPTPTQLFSLLIPLGWLLHFWLASKVMPSVVLTLVWCLKTERGWTKGATFAWWLLSMPFTVFPEVV
jgi:hypothetical protein